MTLSILNKILKKYRDLPPVSVWKTLIVSEGVNNFLSKDCSNNLDGDYKLKHAVKKPVSFDYQVFDCSSDKRVIPAEAIIKDSCNNKSLVKFRYNSKSPFSLKNTSDSKKELKIFFESKGKKILIPLKISLVKERGDKLVSLLGADRLSVVIFDGCWNWNMEQQCKFCDLNPKKKNYKSPVPSLNDLKEFNFDHVSWWEYYKVSFLKELNKSFKKIYKFARPHKHLLIMSGAFIDNKFLWKMILELVESLNRQVSLNKFDTYLNVPPPPENFKNYFLKLKKLGIKQIQINLEVAGRNNFSKTCPGKNQSIGYDNYRKSLIDSVKIFGQGKVRSSFVFTSRSKKLLLTEAEYLAKLGIVMDYSIFQPKKNTPWENKKSPGLHEILEFNLALAKIYQRYKFSGVYCSLSSRSSIINEILSYEGSKKI